jgi:hypothetical protein
MRRDSKLRDSIIKRKNDQWMKVAEQIKTEDPEAYEYLTGTRGMDRIGAGFVSLLASILFAMFDLTASLLVLLGFLIFRWAVIAAPILGTIAILRPASAGFRRLMNAVVAAIFNIIIFGTGAAIYLFAVDLIMSTATLPGWLQVVLVWLSAWWAGCCSGHTGASPSSAGGTRPRDRVGGELAPTLLPRRPAAAPLAAAIPAAEAVAGPACHRCGAARTGRRDRTDPRCVRTARRRRPVHRRPAHPLRPAGARSLAWRRMARAHCGRTNSRLHRLPAESEPDHGDRGRRRPRRASARGGAPGLTSRTEV